MKGWLIEGWMQAERMVDWRMNARDNWINKKDERMVDWRINVRNGWINKKKETGWLNKGWMQGVNE